MDAVCLVGSRDHVTNRLTGGRKELRFALDPAALIPARDNEDDHFATSAHEGFVEVAPIVRTHSLAFFHHREIDRMSHCDGAVDELPFTNEMGGGAGRCLESGYSYVHTWV